MGRSSKDRRDIFYRLAKEEGWRARSAYKLLHMDHELKLLENVKRAVDLCAAPGSWSQVLVQSMRPLQTDGKHIVAVDIQDMAPIPGVVCFKGDITFDETPSKIIELLGSSKADIVICDGAPDVTGYHEFDEQLQSNLFMAALNISVKVLSKGGTFLAKVFRSSKEGVQWLVSSTEVFFKDVMIIKPRSSRSSSIEAYIVGRQFELPADCQGKLLEKTLTPETCSEIPTRMCGSPTSFDSDTNYSLRALIDYKYVFSVPPPNPGVLVSCYCMEDLQPVQMPIKPPYEVAVQLRKSKKLGICIVHSLSVSAQNQKTVTLAFRGGVENLVNCGKDTEISFSETEDHLLTLKTVLDYIVANLIVDRLELFINKDGDVRPGILVLVNDVDWEILGKLDYEIQDCDAISFISTLHGG